MVTPTVLDVPGVELPALELHQHPHDCCRRRARSPSGCSRDGCGELRVQIAGKRVMELPRNCHGLLANVCPVLAWPEEPERPVLRSETREQQNRSAVALV